MSSVEIFEWTFTPHGCFEQNFPIVIDGQTMTVAEGKARVEIASDVFEAAPTILDRFHDALGDHLVGAELFKGCVVSLTGPERETLREDGRRIVYVEMIAIASAEAFGRAEVIARDADGNVIIDTTRDQIQRVKNLGGRIAAWRPKDRTLAAMIASYRAALRDPSDELVHLYEVAEALEVRFKRRQHAQAAVDVTADEWGRFIRLCNQCSLRQGRHRGLHTGPHREASAAELHEARLVAVKMIEGYLSYLEREPVA